MLNVFGRVAAGCWKLGQRAGARAVLGTDGAKSAKPSVGVPMSGAGLHGTDTALPPSFTLITSNDIYREFSTL